jgi:hypothetical protein
MLAGTRPASSYATTLPYTTRTHSYSGWNTTVFGDTRTVGMAGATVGLPDSFLSSIDNPGGLALLMDDADENFSSNDVSDGHLQDRAHPLTLNSVGLAAAFYPWTLSAGYITSSQEGMPYGLLNSARVPTLGVSAHEFRLGVSRVVFAHRVSVGASLNVGRAQEEMTFDQEAGSPSFGGTEYGLGATLGALGQLNQHVLLGLSYTLPMSYGFADASGPVTLISGFYKPVETPGRLGLGVGWVPNRFFRTDLSVFVVGRTAEAALLSDDTTIVGDQITVQPRAGAAYIFADYEDFRGTAFAGTYYEMTRISGSQDRLHVTGGVEFKPWVLTLGTAVDVAPQYSNVLLGVGIDLIKVMIKLAIIPKPYSPPRRGMMPSPLHLSDEGLPRGLVEHWKPHGPDMNVVKVIHDIPVRTGEKVEAVKQALRAKGIISKKPAKKHARKKSPARRKKPRRAKAKTSTPPEPR